MARIVLASYFVRYPLGGMMSYVLQYLTGLQRLGHDVWFVERADYPNACFDPRSQRMSDDAATGIETARQVFDMIGLGDRWCFVDYVGKTSGMTRRQTNDVLRSADVFLDMGTHGAWLDEVRGGNALAVLIDGEPGYTQVRLEQLRSQGEEIDLYDRYYTNGLNVGTSWSGAPTAGLTWHHLPHPVDTNRVTPTPPRPSGPVVTVMNWQSHGTVSFEGKELGQKDVEFKRLLDLPLQLKRTLEVAVAGGNVPVEDLRRNGWSVRDAHVVTASLGRFESYVRASSAEFSVCKNVFVELQTGWFSDRSAFFLSSGRPVVLQDTGYSRNLPTGSGLIAFTTSQEAAQALREVERNHSHHAATARALACDILDAKIVLGVFLDELSRSDTSTTTSLRPIQEALE